MLVERTLFVYGSFSEGMVHFGKIKEYIVESIPAWTIGLAYRLTCGYPVFVKPAHGATLATRIHGSLIKLAAPELVYRLLDEFHGVSHSTPEKSLFFKETVTAATDDGQLQEAEVYSFNPSKLTATSVLIAHGDWRADLKENPTLPSTLTEKQMQYIRRLSASTGREVLPIDIQLYRELMKLGLIVDKGRRLALSKLGQEVARFLP